jgi:hypothetical protein
MGYTDETADRMRTKWNPVMQGYVEVRTISKGYGCLACRGTGQKESK